MPNGFCFLVIANGFCFLVIPGGFPFLSLRAAFSREESYFLHGAQPKFYEPSYRLWLNHRRESRD